MKKNAGVVLKPGKEKAILNRHHWIFSGAVQSMPTFTDGELLPVFSAERKLLGTGYFNQRSSIIGRMIAFDETAPLEALEKRLEEAHTLRKNALNFQQTNAFRLVNGEGDGIPGLVLDVFDRTVVLQSSTKGIDALKPFIADWLNRTIRPKTIYEKSILPVRKEEGLESVQGFLSGVEEDLLSFKENNLLFTSSLSKSQKTGFFLDHREMREWVKYLAGGKNVLNAFSYTGGFSVYALAGGAKRVDSVDISKEAIEMTKHHLMLNGVDTTEHGFYCEDVFTFLREKNLPYDLVILDPPAFAKKKKDIISACRGYKDINRIAMQKMPARSLLLTCSCSHYVDEDLFQKVLFQAAHEARRQVCIVGRHRLAMDHPINLFHPESNYLKSFLLYVQ